MDNLKVEKWVSMDFITDYLDISRESVIKWIGTREMPAHKLGRQWKFKVSEVDEWIRSGGAADKTNTDDNSDEKNDKNEQ